MSNSELLTRINKLQKQHGLILLKVAGGKLFYLKDHYRYLNPGKEAPPFLLGPVKGMSEGLKYISNPIDRLPT